MYKEVNKNIFYAVMHNNAKRLVKSLNWFINKNVAAACVHHLC